MLFCLQISAFLLRPGGDSCKPLKFKCYDNDSLETFEAAMGSAVDVIQLCLAQSSTKYFAEGLLRICLPFVNRIASRLDNTLKLSSLGEEAHEETGRLYDMLAKHARTLDEFVYQRRYRNVSNPSLFEAEIANEQENLFLKWNKMSLEVSQIVNRICTN